MNIASKAIQLDAFLVLALASVIILSRLPFLGAGYGQDPDAWRVASVARTISLTGNYEVSRLPGYPVHEIIASLLWRGGPLLLNPLSAFLGAVGIGFFGLTLKKLNYEHFISAGIALACTPIVFIHSTTSMDYLSALGFILVSLYCLIVRQYSLAGVLFGLAIGCRPTSLLMIVPFILYVWRSGNMNIPTKSIVKFISIAGGVAFFVFLPVIFQYGLHFLTAYGQGYPSFSSVIKRATIDVWGIPGLVGIVIGVIAIFTTKQNKGSKSPTNTSKSLPIVPWVVGIILYLCAFILLPGDAGYLIPIVPMVILILATYLHSRTFLFISYLLIISPFVLGVHVEGKEPGEGGQTNRLSFSVSDKTVFVNLARGPIFEDHVQRVEDIEYLNRVISRLKTLQEPTIVITGTWHPFLDLLFPMDDSSSVRYISLADSSEVRNYIEMGTKVYSLKGQKEYIESVYGYDLESLGIHQVLEQ